ncbi:MAG: zf-HC2 domain-containing protein [Alphaproteobacteria bacterium]|nr:zf-HC2 domain-containing protein [Alphaproteobacteria bacterium]
MTHLTDDHIAAWAAGELAPAERDALEAHADACADCAARLSAGARAEEAMYEVAAASAARAPSGTGWRWPLAGLALAAAALIAVGLSQRPAETTESHDGAARVDVSVECMSAPDLHTCEADALRRGLMTESGRIPRYDRAVCVGCGRDS